MIIWSKTIINNQKRIWSCSKSFLRIHKILKFNICWMLKCNLLKFSFVWDFHNKIVCWIWCNIFWNLKIRLCDKKIEMFSFLPLINNLVTIGLCILLPHISNYIIKYNRYFLYFIWVIFFNIFINIIHINWVLDLSFRIL